MENQGLPRVVVFGLLAVVLIFIFGSSMFITINPGQKGVLFETLGDGLDKETVYGQGLWIIAPWNDMIVYDVKETETFEKMQVLSSNGLPIKIDLSIIHHPVHDRIGYLHDNIGEDYLMKIIQPAVRSVTREVIGNYKPEELYNSKRKEIEDQIFSKTLEIVSKKDIDLPAIYIRDVTLPPTLVSAIEEKLKQEQLSLEYKFKIEKAEKEAQRKEIEANGIAKFQQIVNKTITPQLLKWKGVEATQEIAKSTNAKVIVIGNGDGDLPIILGGQ